MLKSLHELNKGILKHRYAFLTGGLTLVISIGAFFPHVVHAGLLSWLGGLAGDTLDATVMAAVKWIAWVPFYLGSWIVWLASQFLDFAIVLATDPRYFRLNAITAAWTVFRNVANLIFIFVLVYAAFMIILRIEGFNTKRAVATLIIVALLLNFSFFFTGVVIDAGNVVALFLYNSMTSNGAINLGDKLVEALQLSTLTATSPTAVAPTNTQLAVAYLLGSVFLFIAAFALLAGGLLFIIRTVILIVVIMLSPLAFAATILPQTQQYWRLWLHKLLSNVFVAPLYLLMISVVVTLGNTKQLLQTATGGTRQNLHSATFAGQGGDFTTMGGILATYAILIGLIIASYTVSQKLAGDSAGLAVSWSRKVSGAVKGFGGLVATQTIGREATALDKWIAEKAPGRVGYALRSITTIPAKEGKYGYTRNLAEQDKPYEEDLTKRLNRLKTSKDMPKMVTVLRAQTASVQGEAFKSMSPADRAALIPHLTQAESDQFIGKLTPEEREKTEDAERTRNITETGRTARATLHDMSVAPKPALGTPDAVAATAKYKATMLNVRPTQARRLSPDARMNPEIIRNLSPRHLQDLMSNGDLTNDETLMIRDTINQARQVVGGDPELLKFAIAQWEHLKQGQNKALWQIP